MTVATNVYVTPWIWFRFDTQESHPPTFRVSEGVELLHPMLAGRPGMPGDQQVRSHTMEFRVGTRCYAGFTHLVFLSEKQLDPHTAEPIVYNFCRKIRFLARQPWLPPEIESTGFRRPDNPIPDLSAVNVVDHFPPLLDGPIVNLRGAFVDAAATLEQIQEALRLPDDFAFPAYAEFMLDAAHAFDTKDYRRTILYSAIAVEAVATETLTQAYNELLADPKPRPEFRVVQVTERSGQRRIDPVYRALVTNNWTPLVHERPLYLLGRSLMLDDPALYERLHALQQTRNAISHGNRPDPAQRHLQLTREAALDAVARAKDAFAWFGKDTHYPIDRSNLIELGPKQ